ncbi:hypothetical protein B5X24_HaOG201444 [Helicoverpa armigera]|nr:hypothetical protein B5X24_HaOG201444 [Helicoverpa armigera]
MTSIAVHFQVYCLFQCKYTISIITIMLTNEEEDEELWSAEIDYVALSPPPTPQPSPAWLRRSSSIAYVCFNTALS